MQKKKKKDKWKSQNSNEKILTTEALDNHLRVKIMQQQSFKWSNFEDSFITHFQILRVRFLRVLFIVTKNARESFVACDKNL